MNKKANLFLIGAPKSGTTSLYYYLSQHPGILMSSKKEPHYFCDDFNQLTYDEGVYNSYFDNFKSAHKFFGDATADHLYSVNAVPNILKYNPDAYLIAIVRNPVEMAVAFYFEQKWNGKETEDFFTAWDLQEKRLAGSNIPSMVTDKRQVLYKERCSVGSQLERVLQLVDPKKLLVFTLDEFKAPEKVMNRIESFLRLDPYPGYDFAIKNARKTARFKGLNSVISRLAKLRKQMGFNASLGLGKKLLNLNSRQLTIAPEDMEQYYRYIGADFTGEIEKLEAILDKDLSAWKKYAPARAI